MKYAIGTNGGNAAHLTIDGRLTFAEAPQFPKILAELNAVKGLAHLDIRLNGLTFIDSTGMSLFVHIYDASKANNMQVSVHGATGAVSTALDRAAFQTLFDFK